MSRYYNDKGEPVSREEGIALFSDDFNQRRQVARDEIDNFTISTVHLVIDHSYGDGPPLIFETMIFGPSDSPLNENQWRYSTREQALMGHAEAVALVKEREGHLPSPLRASTGGGSPTSPPPVRPTTGGKRDD